MGFFCPNNSPRIKDIDIMMIMKREKQQTWILYMLEEVDPANKLHFA